MKTFKQFNKEARQLDEIAPLIPAALKLGGMALSAYSGLSAANNLRKGKFKQAAFDALGAIPGGRAFKIAKGLGASKKLAQGASALQSINRYNVSGLTPNAYAKATDKVFDTVTGNQFADKEGDNKNKNTTNKTDIAKFGGNKIIGKPVKLGQKVPSVIKLKGGKKK